jgi:hypothetical protein
MEYLLPIWIIVTPLLLLVIDWMISPKVNRNLRT